MDATFLRKTFALIAKGLVEKEQLLQKEPTCRRRPVLS